MSLAQEFFPKLSGGETFIDEALPQATMMLSDASRAVTSLPAKVWDSLNRINPQTGVPEGSVAIMKKRMLAMLMLRTRKTHSHLYRIRLA
jgi:hypothetical protein